MISHVHTLAAIKVCIQHIYTTVFGYLYYSSFLIVQYTELRATYKLFMFLKEKHRLDSQGGPGYEGSSKIFVASTKGPKWTLDSLKRTVRP